MILKNFNRLRISDTEDLCKAIGKSFQNLTFLDKMHSIAFGIGTETKLASARICYSERQGVGTNERCDHFQKMFGTNPDFVPPPAGGINFLFLLCVMLSITFM